MVSQREANYLSYEMITETLFKIYLPWYLKQEQQAMEPNLPSRNSEQVGEQEKTLVVGGTRTYLKLGPLADKGEGGIDDPILSVLYQRRGDVRSAQLLHVVDPLRPLTHFFLPSTKLTSNRLKLKSHIKSDEEQWVYYQPRTKTLQYGGNTKRCRSTCFTRVIVQKGKRLESSSYEGW